MENVISLAHANARCLAQLVHANAAELILVGSELSLHLSSGAVGLALLAHAGQALRLALDAVTVVTARFQNVAVLDLVDQGYAAALWLELNTGTE